MKTYTGEEVATLLEQMATVVLMIKRFPGWEGKAKTLQIAANAFRDTDEED